MDVKSLGDLSQELDGLGLSIEKQLEFLADALEREIDASGGEEVAVLYPIARLLSSISAKVCQDFEDLGTALIALRAARGEI